MWGIELNRHGGVPLARQIYLILRGRMTDGLLKPGDALPSTRELAKQLGISRNTACEAYAMLSDEGFLSSRPGAPTRVAPGLALQSSQASRTSSDFMPSACSEKKCKYAADFRTGKPDFAQFPLFLWRQLLGRAAAELAMDELDYGGEAGLPMLREEVARWLVRARGLLERPEDIFITAGTTQVLSLLPTLPALAGGAFLVEDPCTDFILNAWQQMGLQIRGLPVDGHGMRTELLSSQDLSSVRAVYVTPSHQFPLGGILPAGRRAELIRCASDRGLYIIEDDYDSEFRYAGTPIAPMRSMDSERVIYTGTFSKTLFPALRIGFVILPRALQGQWLQRRTHADNRNTPFEQAALALMLRSRKFDRHVQKMRKLYGQRREILLQALKENFDGAFRPLGDAAGLHMAVQFPGLRFDADFTARARERGIRVSPAEYYAMKKGEHADKLILGFGHMEPEEIRSAVALLGGFMREEFPDGALRGSSSSRAARPFSTENDTSP